MPRVLLVGDDGVLAPLRRQPGVPQFDVEIAAGGVDAVRRLRAAAYQLVITSRRTPVEEDLALLAEMQRVRPGTKAILLAPRATRDDVVAALRAQAFACFSEPVNWVELSALVRAAFDDEQWRDGIEVKSATADWLSLRVVSRLLTAERLVQFMRELASDQPDDTREDLMLAFREILVNAMEHGAGFDPEQVIEVSAVRTDRAIVYYFRDPGPGFRSRNLRHAAASSSPEQVHAATAFREEAGMRPGGFGMLLVRNLVDEVIHNEAGNEVILVKHTK